MTRRGEVIAGTYRLSERIGAGGMGEVYAAEHVRLGRSFAVKLLRPGSEAKATARFRKESKAVALIENEYVVSVVDCGEANDETPYLVMELLRGEDLRSLLARASPLSISRAVNLLCDACHGVAAVHQAGLVHRDLKPGNLFVTRRATGEDWCKVLDFGVAKLSASTSTVEGALIGTVHYMAPEQLENGAGAGSAADVYALGAILYEALSGATVHSATSVQELMFKIMNEAPVRLDERRAEVPRRLADAVQRALSKRPQHRFVTVQELATAIAPFARAAERLQPGPNSDESSSDDTVSSERGIPKAKVRITRSQALAVVIGLCGASYVGALAVRAKGARTASALASASAALPAPSGGLRHETAAIEQLASTPTVTQPQPTPIAPPRPPETSARGPVARTLVAPKPRALAAIATSSAKPQFDFENPYSQ